MSAGAQRTPTVPAIPKLVTRWPRAVRLVERVRPRGLAAVVRRRKAEPKSRVFPGASVAPFPVGMPAGASVLAEAVKAARRGPVKRSVRIDADALVKHQVRRPPAIIATIVLVGVAADLGGSLYLREAMGAKLFEQYLGGLQPPSQSVVTDAAARRLGRLAAPDAVREPMDDVPQVFRDALLRTEDARFYAHDGVDRRRMLGALKALLQGEPQGGSTLTMQLAKLIKKDSARTLRRKLEDIALALELDERLGKDEVLRVYANQAYFGSGVYGLGEACRYYFARERCQGLRLEEAAYLVSLLPAPAEISRDEARARARRNMVLELMREPLPPSPDAPKLEQFARRVYLQLEALIHNRIDGRVSLEGRYTWAELDAAKATPLTLVRKKVPPSHPFVLETVRQDLEKRLGPAIYQQGLEIRLTVDSEVQRAAEQALTTGLDRLRTLQREGRAARKQPPDEGPDDLDGGLVVLDPRTGNLLAYVPGADFRTSQVPFAARPIQVGSSLKPYVYAEFFEQGRGDLTTIMPDAPICIGGWCPKNYDGKYRGAITLEKALYSSLNTVAVRVAQSVGVDAIVARMRLLGVTSPLTANLPMALGASELTLLELAGLYASLYEGRVVQPRLVEYVRDRNGEVLYGGAQPDRPLAYKRSTLAMLHQALGGVVGPGGTAGALGRDLEAWFGVPKDTRLGEVPGLSPQVACKTGTHDGFTRAGIGCLVSDSDFGPLAIVSYVGHRMPRGLGEGLSGGRIVAPIIGELVKAVTVQSRSAGAFRPFPEKLAPPAETELLPLTEDEAAPTVAAPNGVDAAITARFEADPNGAAFASARAAMAGPAEPHVLPGSDGDEGDEIASAPRAMAPRDWSGLMVLDTEVLEATGPDIVSSFLDAGGSEAQLEELAPMLQLSLERRVVHKQRLLDSGFTDQSLDKRVLVIAKKIGASLTRMIDESGAVTFREQWDPQTSVVVEMDGDRRIERIYRFPRPLQLMRVTHHASTGKLLSLETVEADGTRHALVRRGEKMIALESRRLVVDRGALEPSWLAAGLAPAQMDGLRALLGGDLDINRIPRGFTMDLLLADGVLVAAEAQAPKGRGIDEKVAAVRTEGACVTGDGMPCARRWLPLPLAEARAYNRRGAARTGTVIVQRARPGSVVGSPAASRVAFVHEDRGLVVLETEDGRMLGIEGVRPGVALDKQLVPGEPVGLLDARGTLVMRALGGDDDGKGDSVDVFDVVPTMGETDPSLAHVADWWRELHAWLRGERPVSRGTATAEEPS